MNLSWQETVAVAGVVAAGINGGAFFTFSNFVMPALAKLPPAQGTAAMQAINVAAPNPAFMATIFGAGLIGVPAAVSAFGNLDEPQAKYYIAAAAMSLATIAITAAFHVPRNDALAGLDPDAASTVAEWAEYLVTWTRGNHVRMVTSVASAAFYALALRT